MVIGVILSYSQKSDNMGFLGWKGYFLTPKAAKGTERGWQKYLWVSSTERPRKTAKQIVRQRQHPRVAGSKFLADG